jgi:SH3-like domain-containing protein
MQLAERSNVIWRLGAVLVAVGTILAGGCPAVAAGDAATGPVTGLPVPRFVSIKPNKVNVHIGPTMGHEVVWAYNRAGLPVEITAEFENWRRIRDWEGAEGWVYHSLLSGRRTGLVTSKSKDDLIPLREKPDVQAAVVARLEMGVLGSVKRCTGNWCRVTGDGFDGWVPQERLWGVYPNEQVE